jgi:hypothetical protein
MNKIPKCKLKNHSSQEYIKVTKKESLEKLHLVNNTYGNIITEANKKNIKKIQKVNSKNSTRKFGNNITKKIKNQINSISPDAGNNSQFKRPSSNLVKKVNNII